MIRLGYDALKNCPLCGDDLTNTEIGGRDRIVCSVCDFVHWDNPKPVTATLIPYENGLVLVRRKFEPFVGDWCLPGGFIEALEQPEESAAREVFEETGLTVSDLTLINAAGPGHNVNVIILFYVANKVTGSMVPGDDASEVGAFAPDKLPANVAFELHRRSIREWFERQAQAAVTMQSAFKPC